MKNSILLTLTIILFGVSTSFAQQVFYSNDFTNGMEGMTVVDVDGLTPHPNVTQVVPQGKWTTFGTNNKYAISTSWYNPAGKANDWMMTPAVTIPAELTSVKLSWRARSANSTYKESYKVYVSTTGGTQPSDFTTELFSTEEETTSWNDHVVDVTSYAGQTVYFAFQHNANDKVLLLVDDISVYVPAPVDLAVESARFENLMAGEQKIKIAVKNEGLNNITSYDFTVVEDNTNQVLTQTVSGLNIPFGAADTFTTSALTLSVDPSKMKYFTTTISNVNGGTEDADSSNNSFVDSFVVRNLVPQFTGTDTQGNQKDLHATLASGKAVVLDFMASWCTPCKNSTPDLNSFYVANSDKAEVWALTVEEDDNNEKLNSLNWGGTYPKFAYTGSNDMQYFHYSSSRRRGFNTEGSIPFFVMICPNISDPANSTILLNEVGYNGTINERYTTALGTCQAVGLNNIESLTDFNLYPNPATDVINLEFSLEEKTPLTIEVRNLMGQLVKTTSTVEYGAGYHAETINVSELVSGAYTVVIRSGEKTTTTRFNVVK